MECKKRLRILKRTDEIIDLNPDIRKASKKVLNEVIKETDAKGGTLFIFDFIDNTLKILSKEGKIKMKIVKKAFTKSKIVLKKTELAVPIMLKEKKFGLIYLFGKKFTKKDVTYVNSSETILDGRFKHEADAVGLKAIFKRYVDEKTLKKILKYPDKKYIVGERRNCSILFADLNGFTDYVNNAKSEDVIDFLNNYFKEMSKIALKKGGTIDKLIGDAIMIVFGAPLPQKNHAFKAVATAKEMVKKGKKVIKKYKIKNGGISVGIATGRVVAGNIGYEKIMDYTVIGKKVNLASRLTNLAGKNQIFVDENTERLGNKVKYKNLGKKKVKGFGSVKVFQVKL